MPPSREHPEHVPRHPIRVAAERTGVTADALRAWERRYRAVSPPRSEGAQRLYSDLDIERLRLIAELARAGYALGDLAQRSTTALLRLARTSGQTDRPPAAASAARADASINRLLTATRTLDAGMLRAALTRAVLADPVAALDSVVSPLLHRIGELWAAQSIGVAQEHLASAVLRDVLGSVLQTAIPAADAPTLVATTVAGENHEFGTMMASVVAAVAGWRVLYLGPNLPAAELARISKRARARVTCIGIARTNEAIELRDELHALREGLGQRAAILAGGDATQEHRLSLRQTNITLVESRGEFRAALDGIWTRAS